MDAAVRKSLCYFLLLFLLLFLALPGITVLVTLLILHPQKPIFSIQTVKVESYKLQVKSDKEIFLSSLLSLNLTALNPNKVGISYDTSRLHILDQDHDDDDDDGITVGMLRVPRFHQPPKSKDINVAAQVIFGCVNLSKILSGKLLLQQQDNANTNKISLSQSQFRILGDVKAQVHLFHLPLPKFKVQIYSYSFQEKKKERIIKLILFVYIYIGFSGLRHKD